VALRLNIDGLYCCTQGKLASSAVLSNLYAMGVTECDNMLMHVGVSQKMSDKERDAVLPLLATGFKVAASQSEHMCTVSQKKTVNIVSVITSLNFHQL